MKCLTRQFTLIIAVIVIVVGVGFGEAYSSPNPNNSRPWTWPTKSAVPVIRAFDNLIHDWLPGNRGVDLDYPEGAPVYSPADGVVTVARVIVDRPVLTISHGQLRSTFEPVEALVKDGDHVRRGQQIGILASGKRRGLHWGIKTGKKQYVDPLKMLTGPVVLKPWAG